MPGLKGAYHRQCLSCHMEWSHDTACSRCHTPKVRPEVCAVPDSQPDVANAIARMSKPVKLPETYVYNTSYSPLPVVTFHHGDHAHACTPAKSVWSPGR